MAMSGHPPVLRQRSARVSDTNLTGPNLGGYPPASRWRTADATDSRLLWKLGGCLPVSRPRDASGHWQWKTSAPSHANHVTRTLHWLPPSLRGVLASARWVNQYFVQFEHCYLTTNFTKSCIKQYRLFLHFVLMVYYEYKGDLCG